MYIFVKLCKRNRVTSYNEINENFNYRNIYNKSAQSVHKVVTYKY